MAVPKKKRIGYRIMNRGSQFRSWHLLMLNLTLAAAPLSHLKRLISISRASMGKRAALASVLQLFPKFRLKPLSLKKKSNSAVPFDKEVPPFSMRFLILQYRRKPLRLASPASPLLPRLSCQANHLISKSGHYFINFTFVTV